MRPETSSGIIAVTISAVAGNTYARVLRETGQSFEAWIHCRTELRGRKGVMPRAYDMLKKKLEDECVRLKGEIKQRGMLGEERLGYSNHMADHATEVFEQTKNLSLRGSLEDSLRRVEEALQRFDEGSYGICEDCSRVIEWGRLKVLPYTRFCVECVRRHERES